MAATAAPDLPQTERVAPDLKPQQLSFPLPRALHTTGHVHLTFLDHCIMAFLTTSTPGDSAGTVKPLGSFVYAMPDRTSSNSTIATTIYTSASSIEYTTRVAKIVARRTKKPVYVGCSIDPNGLGLQVEEEMEGLRKIVDLIVEKFESQQKQ
ncbi:uncharacterized protein N7498_005813 [Penicillium cinerascens]|uniref:Proteasome assembly chaperone 4 n=1 Tax=Penicillium cinerascens TaxID=70096 RepID=A0A9W9T0J1_9EURO|nr:uncharacterized protein N7498_005813 [Penicillium cinerascens]KAJ5204934.1 hypothetical protein N7498_005813 [Penicillium cinerascens]